MPKSKSKKDFLKTPKGTRDILPNDALYWQSFEDKAGDLAKAYGFKNIRTPHIEHADLFMPTLGETSDIVEKQMYSFRTRGGDSLVLRPEWTVPAVRAFFEHGMHTWPQPVMLYTSGSFFRHENPQKGRFREFGQFDVEVLGEESPIADALVIRLFALIFQEMGVKNFVVHINTLGDKECRGEYKKELLSFYRRKINSLCRDCKRRIKTNPLRLLDCKESSCVEVRGEAPKMMDFVCSPCRTHFKGVLDLLDELGVPYFINPFLVRGLDYYSRTVFEIFVEEPPREKEKEKEKILVPALTDSAGLAEGGAGIAASPEIQPESAGKESSAPSSPIALASGGRYDYLAESLGQKKTYGVGGAVGIDRFIEELKSRGIKPAKEKKVDVFLIQIGPQAKKKSLALFEVLRKAKLNLAHSFGKDGLRAQLQSADKAGASWALIIGQKEALDGTLIVRDMASGAQETVPQGKVLDQLKKKMKSSVKPAGQ